MRLHEVNESLVNQLESITHDPCVSIIMRTDQKSFADRERIRLQLKNYIKQARHVMQSEYAHKDLRPVDDVLSSLAQSLDFDQLGAGLGIYVSPASTHLISFPVTVKERVIIGDRFDVDALKYCLPYMIHYVILVLSLQKSRCFNGYNNHINEVENLDFPIGYTDDFQKKRSSPFSFYNIEESKIDHARKIKYYRIIDDLLSNYLKGKSLILIGVDEHLGDYNAITKFTSDIIIQLRGNYDKSSLSAIRKLVWPHIEAYIDSTRQA